MPAASPKVSPAVAAEAAQLLRVVLAELPPVSLRDRGAARRIEGAAMALDVIADAVPNVADLAHKRLFE